MPSKTEAGKLKISEGVPAVELGEIVVCPAEFTVIRELTPDVPIPKTLFPAVPIIFNEAEGIQVPIPTLPFITVNAAFVVLVVPIPTPPPFPILILSKEFVLKVKSPELDAEFDR